MTDCRPSLWPYFPWKTKVRGKFNIKSPTSGSKTPRQRLRLAGRPAATDYVVDTCAWCLDRRICFGCPSVALCNRLLWSRIQRDFSGPPILGPLSHTIPIPPPIRIPKDMGMVGMVWEAYHKGIPLLGVPGITLEECVNVAMLCRCGTLHLDLNLGYLLSPVSSYCFSCLSHLFSCDALTTKLFTSRHQGGVFPFLCLHNPLRSERPCWWCKNWSPNYGYCWLRAPGCLNLVHCNALYWLDCGGFRRAVVNACVAASSLIGASSNCICQKHLEIKCVWFSFRWNSKTCNDYHSFAFLWCLRKRSFLWPSGEPVTGKRMTGQCSSAAARVQAERWETFWPKPVSDPKSVKIWVRNFWVTFVKLVAEHRKVMNFWCASSELSWFSWSKKILSKSFSSISWR